MTSPSRSSIKSNNHDRKRQVHSTGYAAALLKITQHTRLFSIILHVSGTVLLLACISCGMQEKAEYAPDTRFLGDRQPVQESWDVNMQIFQKDRIHAIVSAGHFAEYKKNNIITRHLNDGVKVTYFDSIGAVSSTLTAEKATVYENNDMEAFNSVVLTSLDGTLKTDYIKRFSESKKLWSDRYVVIEKKNETIRGYGFESDESLRNYTIFKASGETDIE